MPTNTYMVVCERIEQNPNQGTSPFSQLAYFKAAGRPLVELKIAALPDQYEPGVTYGIEVSS